MLLPTLMAAWPHGSHWCCSYGIAMVSQAHTLLDSSPDKQAHFIFPLKKKKKKKHCVALLCEFPPLIVIFLAGGCCDSLQRGPCSWLMLAHNSICSAQKPQPQTKPSPLCS